MTARLESHGDDPLTAVLAEIQTVVAKIDREHVDRLTDAIVRATRIFVAGEGRSGFMGKAFAMRLMHLGLAVHVVGESTTPSIGSGDTVIAISGSGTTAGTVRVAEQARTSGASLHCVTTDPGSPLAQLSETVLVLPAATKYRRPGEAPTVQPLSSLFDQTTHVVLDVVCLHLAQLRKVDNSAAAAAHANTE